MRPQEGQPRLRTGTTTGALRPSQRKTIIPKFAKTTMRIADWHGVVYYLLSGGQPHVLSGTSEKQPKTIRNRQLIQCCTYATTPRNAPMPAPRKTNPHLGQSANRPVEDFAESAITGFISAEFFS